MDREAARRRAEAAERYRPQQIELLLVDEAPPCKLDRYFYFESVPQHDGIFRYVSKVLLGATPDREDKSEALAELQERGVFLVHLSDDPDVDGDLRPYADDLVARCRELAPERIVVIKTTVFDAVYEPLAAAGLPVVDARLPFPGSGQQRRFEEGFAQAITEEALR